MIISIRFFVTHGNYFNNWNHKLTSASTRPSFVSDRCGCRVERTLVFQPSCVREPTCAGAGVNARAFVLCTVHVDPNWCHAIFEFWIIVIYLSLVRYVFNSFFKNMYLMQSPNVLVTDSISWLMYTWLKYIIYTFLTFVCSEIRVSDY